MLDIKDIVALAKAGYKPADVKELITMTQNQDPEPKPETEPKTEPATEPKTEPETKPETEPETKPAQEPTPEQVENEKLKKQIEELQIANTRKPVQQPEPRSDEDVISDFVKSFM